MNIPQLLGAIELGLLFSLVALGVYLTFRVIQFPDLTIDGTFPLGAATAAAFIINGFSPLTATFIATIAGALAGIVTGYLHVRWKILGLLAGILTMTALYSINLRIMGKPNIALLQTSSLFSTFSGAYNAIILLSITLIIVLFLLYRLLASQFGLAIRAIGINPRVSPAYGISVNTLTLIGLALSNALVALAGALFAQIYGFADISLGTGTLVAGLASVIIGERLFLYQGLITQLLACIAGSILYRTAITIALNMQNLGLQASDLNFITTIIVVLAMSIPAVREKKRKTDD
jgi:putative ABC transport system permease protein